MCEYCEKIKANTLVSYDNYKSMKISFGQYQGVNVFGSVQMKGNMLSIACGGSYRTESDCYYEEEGLDCDNENAFNSKPNYIKIEYCPFCGRKLDDYTYERERTKDDIHILKDELKWLEQDLRDYNIFVRCHWYCNKRVHNVEVWPGVFKDRTEYDYIDYKNDNPLTIKEISELFPKIFLNIYYGCPQDKWNKRIYSIPPEFTRNTKIITNVYFAGEYKSIYYLLTDKTYFELVKFGYIKHDEEKYNELKKKQEDIKKSIENTKDKIEKNKDYLNKIR